MAPYAYSSLKAETNEIRLVTIFPGNFEEPILITLSHQSFNVPEVTQELFVNLDEHRQALPPGWDAFETLDGRIVYNCMKDGQDFSSWTHPDPMFQAITKPDKVAIDNAQVFEALSYSWSVGES